MGTTSPAKLLPKPPQRPGNGEDGADGKSPSVTLAFRYRAEVTSEQDAYLRRCDDGFRQMWNDVIAWRTGGHRLDTHPCGRRPTKAAADLNPLRTEDAANRSDVRRFPPCALRSGHDERECDSRARCAAPARLEASGRCLRETGHDDDCSFSIVEGDAGPCGYPLGDGSACALWERHSGRHSPAGRCGAARTIEAAGPCIDAHGHVGPCRPRVDHGRRRFISASPPSQWMTRSKPTFRFASGRTADGGLMRWGYAAVPNVVLRAAPRKVQDAFQSYRALRDRGDWRSEVPGFRSRRRPPAFEYQTQKDRDDVLIVDPTPSGSPPKWAKIRVPMPDVAAHAIGDPFITVRYHRPVPAAATIKHVQWAYVETDGHWYVSLIVTIPAPTPAPPGPVLVGVDRGVNVLMAPYSKDTRTGEVRTWMVAPSPGLTPGQAQRLRLLERSLARKHHLDSPTCWKDGRHIKGGCRWRQHKSSSARRVEAQVAKLRARDARVRRETIEVATRDLIFADGTWSAGDSHQPADVVVFEALNVKSMTRSAKGTVAEPGSRVKAKQGLNRSIQRSSWTLLRRRVEQKAARAALDGRTVVTVGVDPRNTSRTCSACGHVAKGNRHGQVFRCRSCRYEAHADTNASMNILDRHLNPPVRQPRSPSPATGKGDPLPGQGPTPPQGVQPTGSGLLGDPNHRIGGTNGRPGKTRGAPETAGGSSRRAARPRREAVVETPTPSAVAISAPPKRGDARGPAAPRPPTTARTSADQGQHPVGDHALLEDPRQGTARTSTRKPLVNHDVPCSPAEASTRTDGDATRSSGGSRCA